jgi:hypothetical protein
MPESVAAEAKAGHMRGLGAERWAPTGASCSEGAGRNVLDNHLRKETTHVPGTDFRA